MTPDPLTPTLDPAVDPATQDQAAPVAFKPIGSAFAPTAPPVPQAPPAAPATPSPLPFASEPAKAAPGAAEGKSWFEWNDLNPFLRIPQAAERSVRDVVQFGSEYEPATGKPGSYFGDFEVGALQFASYFVPAMAGARLVTGALGAARAVGTVGRVAPAASKAIRIAEGLLAGAAADFTMSPQGAALSNFLSSLPNETAQEIGGILSSDEDDSAVSKRLKGVLEGALVGGILTATVNSLRAARFLAKGKPDEAIVASREAATAMDEAARVDATALAEPASRAPEPPSPPKVEEVKPVAALPEFPPGQEASSTVMPSVGETIRGKVDVPPEVRRMFRDQDVLHEIIDSGVRRERTPSITNVVPEGPEGASGFTGKLAPARMSALELAEAELSKGDLNTAHWDGTPRGAIERYRSIEWLADHVHDNTIVESVPEQVSLDLARLQEATGGTMSAHQKGVIDAAARKPELAKELSKLHTRVRLTLAMNRGHLRATSDAADAFLKSGAPKASMQEAQTLDLLLEQLQLAVSTRAATSEMGRGLGSLNWAHAWELSKDAIEKLKGRVKAGETLSETEALSLAAAEDKDLPFATLLAQSKEKYEAKVERLGGRKRIAQTMQQAASLSGLEVSTEQASAAIARSVQGLTAPKFLEFPLEVFVNSILSGPRTIVNVVGQQFLQGIVWQPLRRALGAKIGQGFAALRGDAAGVAEYASTARGALSTVRHTFNSETMSGLRSVFTNAVKTGELTVLDPVAATMGHTFHGEPKIAYEPIREWLKQTFPKADPDNPYFRAVYWAMTEKGANGGYWIRTPGRVLTATDDATKFVVTKAILAGELESHAIEKFGPNTVAASEWVRDKFAKVFDGSRLKTAELVEAKAREVARDLAPIMGTTEKDAYNVALAQVQRDAGVDDAWLKTTIEYAAKQAHEAASTLKPPTGSLAATIIEKSNQHVWPRFFLPFMTSSWSNISTALRPLDLPGYVTWLSNLKTPAAYRNLDEIRSALARELLSPDPRVRADAIGRVATAATFAIGITGLASMRDELGLPKITGAGPRNKEAKAALRNAGWMPYSVRVGNTYVSYARADPVSTLVGIMADLADFGRYTVSDDYPSFEKVAGAVVNATATTIREKSYLQGLSDLMGFVTGEKDVFDWAKSTAVSMIVPNFVTQVGQNVEGLLRGTDPVSRETRDFADSVFRRVPWFDQYAPKMYDDLGAEIPKGQFLGLDSAVPIQVSEVSKDPVRRELLRIGAKFGKPEKRQGNIDLTSVRDAKGNSAYDRMRAEEGTAEIDGKVLHSQLEEIIGADWYNSLPEGEQPDGSHPKRDTMRRAISGYRRNAHWRLLDEDSPAYMPELKAAVMAQHPQ